MYRKVHKSGKEFTWANPQKTIKCRLDRFYISKNLIPSVKYIGITPVPDKLTDHSLVKLDLKLNGEQKVTGNGFWKCNTGTLKDPEFIQDFLSVLL